jgi:hypothetical protein
MKAELIKLNGCYRMKDEVFAGCVQASGRPFQTPDVTVVRIAYPTGRKRAWYYDANGNAFRAEDLSGFAPKIEVEL